MNTLRQRGSRAAAHLHPSSKPSPSSCSSSSSSSITQRRLASTEHHGLSSHASAPATENLGRGSWLVLASLPGAYIVYSLSRGDKSQGWLQKLADKYNEPHDVWVERNALHTRMVEQAGHDKNLFYNAGPKDVWREISFPEQLNTGSPWAVPAGHYMNMDKMVAYYTEKHFKEEEEKLKLMQEGQLPAQLRAKKGKESADEK